MRQIIFSSIKNAYNKVFKLLILVHKKRVPDDIHTSMYVHTTFNPFALLWGLP